MVHVFLKPNQIIMINYLSTTLFIWEGGAGAMFGIVMFVLTVLICPIITGLAVNYIYDKIKG